VQNTSLNDANFNFVQFLQEIASEQEFEVTYVDIEEKSITGIYQKLSFLNASCMKVCFDGHQVSVIFKALSATDAVCFDDRALVGNMECY
jgi:RISC-loading complex subunit TARBP2